MELTEYPDPAALTGTINRALRAVGCRLGWRAVESSASVSHKHCRNVMDFSPDGLYKRGAASIHENRTSGRISKKGNSHGQCNAVIAFAG